MTTAASLTAKLLLDASRFQKGMGDATRTAGDFEARMKQVGQTMQKVGAGMTMALTVPIVAFATSAVKSAMDSEMAMAELEAVIQSTGGAAGVTADEIEDMANELQNVTMFSDEAIINGQSMLLTFTKIGKDVFPQATTAMLNMAQKFGSVDAAAVQLGKALNDPIEGVTALRRVGVMLSAEQENQIKGFMAVNDIASAQKVILQELEVEFGGLAEAAGDTAAGKMQIYNNKLDSMKEALGSAIIPSLIRFMDALTPVIQAIADAPPWVQNMIVALLALVAVAGPLVSFIGTLMTLGPAVTAVAGFFTGTLIPALSAVASFIFATAIPAVVAFVAANAAWIVPLLLVAATVYLVYMAFKTNFMGITTTIEQLWAIIKYYFEKAWQSTVGMFLNYLDRLKTNWQNGLNFLLSIAQSIFMGIINLINYVIEAINNLGFAFATIQPPDWLTPGSPTPFELGLVGIKQAMDELYRTSIPGLGASLVALPAPALAMSGGNSGAAIHYEDNSRYQSGISASERLALRRASMRDFEKAMKAVK